MCKHTCTHTQAHARTQHTGAHAHTHTPTHTTYLPVVACVAGVVLVEKVVGLSFGKFICLIVSLYSSFTPVQFYDLRVPCMGLIWVGSLVTKLLFFLTKKLK